MFSIPLALALVLAPQLPSEWIDAFLAGSRALEQGELGAALDSLEQVQQALPGHGPSAYLLACAHARAGNPGVALDWLERAGDLDPAQLAWDPWLDPLRGEESFEDLGQRARKDGDRTRSTPGELVWDGEPFPIARPWNVVARAHGGGGRHLLLDPSSGELIVALTQPGERIRAVTTDPRGRWIALSGTRSDSAASWLGLGGLRPIPGGQAHFLRIHDAANGDLLRELQAAGQFAELRTDVLGERLLASGDEHLASAVFRTSSWKRIATLPPADRQERISPDGKRILFVSRSGGRNDIAFYDVDEREIIVRHRIGAAPLRAGLFGFSEAGGAAYVVDPTALVTHLFDPLSGARLPFELRSKAPPSAALALPGQARLALIEAPGTLALFALDTGERLAEFALPATITGFGDVSRDGERLLLFGWKGPLVLFETDTGRIAWESAPGGPFMANDARFAQDGRELLVATDRGFERRDGKTGELLGTQAGAHLRSVVAVAGTGPTAFVGTSDGSLREVAGDSGRTLRTLRYGGEPLIAVALSADGSTLAFSTAEGRSWAMDLSSGEVHVAHEHSRAPQRTLRYYSSIALTADGSRALLSVVFEGSTLLDLARGEALAFVPLTERYPFRRSCLSPDGTRFAAVGPEPNRVGIFTTLEGAPAGPELHTEHAIEVLAFEPAGNRIWAATDQGYIAVFDLVSGAELRRIDIGDLNQFYTSSLASITFSPDGRTAVAGTTDFAIVVGWDVASGERLWSFDYSGGNPSGMSSVFSASGAAVYVYGQSSNNTRVVDARTGEFLHDLSGRGLSRLLPILDGTRILAEGSRGLELIAADSARTLWSRLELAHEGWLLRSPDSGHIDGTRAALESTHLALERGSLPLDALAAVLLDPAKVRASAAGIPLAPAGLPEPPSLTFSEPQPRVLELGEHRPKAVLVLQASATAGIVGFEQRKDGESSFIPVPSTDGRSTLRIELERPLSAAAHEYRWRAIAADGLASRALYLRVAR